VFEYASLLRANGELDFLPMGSLAKASMPPFASAEGNQALPDTLNHDCANA